MRKTKTTSSSSPWVLAKRLEDIGNYEAAVEALGRFWNGTVSRPDLSGLNSRDAAEVLLRVGALIGHIGSTRQTERSQETAKDLILESAEVFQRLNLGSRVADASIERAICYWREGAFDEARVVLHDVLQNRAALDPNLIIQASLVLANVERSAGRTNETLHILNSIQSNVEQTADHSLRGKFHSQLALTLRNLGESEAREDYLDRALIEYAAASYHFEQAGYSQFLARIENNIGFLYSRLGRFSDAHTHLERAGELFKQLGDGESLAQVDETVARTLLAEGRHDEAEMAARSAANRLEEFPDQQIYSMILTTWATTLSRLGRVNESREILQQAITAGELSGDPASAGRAMLTLIEENAQTLRPTELIELYARADICLSLSHDSFVLNRLRACARVVVNSISSGAKSRKRKPFHSCFISHSHKDNEFVERLHARLKRAGVSVWFAPTDVKGGRKLFEQIETEIKKNEKLLIVLSDNSLESEWVKTEIREARHAEQKTNRRKLFPISLVDISRLKDWKCFDADSGEDLAVEIRQYFIPDFSTWEDTSEFEKAVRKLLRALRAVASDATDSLPVE